MQQNSTVCESQWGKIVARRVAGGVRLRALRRGLSTEDIVRAYGTAMCESSRAGRIATGIAATKTATQLETACGCGRSNTVPPPLH
jgi:hypothetical protein